MRPRGRNVTKHKIRTKKRPFFFTLIILVLHQHRWSLDVFPFVLRSLINRNKENFADFKNMYTYRRSFFADDGIPLCLIFSLSLFLCLFATSICETYYGPQNCSVCINIRMLLVLLFKALTRYRQTNFIPNSEQSVMCML